MPGSRQPELLMSSLRRPCLEDGQADNPSEESELIFHLTPTQPTGREQGTLKGEDLWLNGRIGEGFQEYHTWFSAQFRKRGKKKCPLDFKHGRKENALIAGL